MGSFTVGNWLGAFAFTYLIHSTLLLGFCWAWVKAARPQSYYFRDWAWKSAATIGVLTALKLAT